MPEAATATPPPAPDPPAPQSDNERTIPPEYYDLVWDLKLQGLRPPAIAKVLTAAGVSCSRYIAYRTVRWLAKQRKTEEQARLLRDQARAEACEAHVVRERLQDQLNEIDEHLIVAWEERDAEKVLFHARAARALRSSLKEQNRIVEAARKSQVDAEVRADEAERTSLRLELQLERILLKKRLIDLKAAEKNGSGQPTATPPPSAAAPKETASPGPEKFDHEDPELLDATISYPADGALLNEPPAVYAGKCDPCGEVMVTVDDQEFDLVPGDPKGNWRVPGNQVPNLEPGEHTVIVRPLTPEGRMGRAKVVTFTLLSLFLVLFPLSSFAQASSLLVNAAISRRCGLVRPPIAVLRDRASAPAQSDHAARLSHDRPGFSIHGPDNSSSRGKPP